MKQNNIWAFTLTELIVAIMISTIVLIFTFHFIAQTIGTITDSRRDTENLARINDINQIIKNYRVQYSSGSLLFDGTAGQESDIIILHNEEKTDGVLLGPISSINDKIIRDLRNYKKNYFAARILSEGEISEILATNNKALEKIFLKDKIITDLYIKEFQADWYNSGSILNIDMEVIRHFQPDLESTPVADLPKQLFTHYNLNF